MLSYGQELADTTRRHKLRLDHYASVQVNELTKQILAVNNNPSANSVVNPYLVNYEVVERKSKWGLRIGGGYSFNSSTIDQEISGSVYTTSIKEGTLNLRIGAEKLMRISDRWQCGIGADFVMTNGKRNAKFSESSMGSWVDSTITTNMKGGGPSAMLRFGITKHIFLGTETSFYYVSGNRKVKTDSFGYPYYTNQDNKDKVQDARFYLPVTFYLAIKM